MNSYVNDTAGLLNEEELNHLHDYHRVLMVTYDIHFKLVTLVESEGNIDEVAVELFADLGKYTSSARGLLFLVDPKGK